MALKRKLAIAIGLLFIITMILGMIDAYTVAPLLKTQLSNIFLNKGKIYIGAFSILFMSIGVVGIAILFYPILKASSKLTALTYLSARIIECLLLLVGVLVYFLLVDLSKLLIDSGLTNDSNVQIISNLLISSRYITYQIAMIVLGIVSMLLCYSFYKSIIIPRFISIFGFIGYGLLFVSAVLDLLNIIDTTGIGGLLYIPGGIFEILLLPIWLFIKGFNIPSNDLD